MSTKKCQSCHFYKAYYEKALSEFLKYRMGFCSKHKQPVQANYICELYCKRKYVKQTYSTKQLDVVINDIKKIICLFADDN